MLLVEVGRSELRRKRPPVGIAQRLRARAEAAHRPRGNVGGCSRLLVRCRHASCSHCERPGKIMKTTIEEEKSFKIVIIQKAGVAPRAGEVICCAHNTKRRSATPRRPGGELPQFESHSRTEGGHGPGRFWRVDPSSILSMADSEAALKKPVLCCLYYKIGPGLPGDRQPVGDDKRN